MKKSKEEDTNKEKNKLYLHKHKPVSTKVFNNLHELKSDLDFVQNDIRMNILTKKSSIGSSSSSESSNTKMVIKENLMTKDDYSRRVTHFTNFVKTFYTKICNCNSSGNGNAIHDDDSNDKVIKLLDKFKILEFKPLVIPEIKIIVPTFNDCVGVGPSSVIIQEIRHFLECFSKNIDEIKGLYVTMFQDLNNLRKAFNAAFKLLVCEGDGFICDFLKKSSLCYRLDAKNCQIKFDSAKQECEKNKDFILFGKFEAQCQLEQKKLRESFGKTITNKMTKLKSESIASLISDNFQKQDALFLKCCQQDYSLIHNKNQYLLGQITNLLSKNTNNMQFNDELLRIDIMMSQLFKY